MAKLIDAADNEFRPPFATMPLGQCNRYASRVLKRRRLSEHLSQKQVADIIRVERSTVAKYENGTHVITFLWLVQLSRVFGCPVHELIQDITGEAAA